MAAWIKMRGNLWDDPRVSALVEATDSSEAVVIGALYWLWSTADAHTTDGAMPGLTARQVNRKTGVPGFAEALQVIGWIEFFGTGGARIVRFDEHNGESAKRRASEAKRKASARDADKKRTPCGGGAELEKEKEKEKEKDQKQEQSTAAPSTGHAPTNGSDGSDGKAKPSRAERVAEITRDAIESFNASKLTKAHGGLVPNVDAEVGVERRRKQVAKCISIARSICAKDYGSERITREFWDDYWAVCLADEHKSGRAGGGKDHPNWVPSFEYLTRDQTMLEVYDRIGGDDAPAVVS